MKCDFDPVQVKGSIGMFHCPECGEMIMSGEQHPDYDIDYDTDPEFLDDIEAEAYEDEDA